LKVPKEKFSDKIKNFKYSKMKENKLGLPADFFKQFKSKEQFQEFFQEMFKEGGQQMLQGELDEHLGYEKHSQEGRNSGNSRNGSSTKKVKSESLGDLALSIPRDRNSSFEPQLTPNISG
jgi:putative transposase